MIKVSNNKRDTLIIWREKIPDVEKGAFSHISKQWGNEVKCFYLQTPDRERTNVGWGADSYANVVVEQISPYASPEEFIRIIIATYPNAIHLFGGLRSQLQKYINEYIKQTNGKKFVCIAERPVMKGHFIKRILKILIYTLLSFKYNRYLSAFLVMGDKGVKRYATLGFSKKTLFPFMYNPLITQQTSYEDLNKIEVRKPIKFLYLGRFDYQYKGCDFLIKAFDMIDDKLSNKWSLTIVGGYGKQKDEMIAWANSKENIFFDGSWDQKNIIKNMAEFDVCVVPSREDGWNLNPNYSIYAHIGMIISDEAVSHEIVEKAGNGIVYHYNEIETLKKHIEFTIANSELIYKWKHKTFAFQHNISSEAVGNYFIDIMDYTYYENSKKPICPWL